MGFLLFGNGKILCGNRNLKVDDFFNIIFSAGFLFRTKLRKGKAKGWGRG